MDWTGYGDSTRTGDNKYVLACFRADANLSWVVDLRSFLNIPELKYKDYSPRRHHVASNPRVQANLMRGLGDAELTIVDAQMYREDAYFGLVDKGAELGGDFDWTTLNDLAADGMLRDSPFGLTNPDTGFGFPADGTFRWRESYSDKLEELPAFDPTDLKRRAGGKLRDVEVLAARAHSIMSPTEYRELQIIVNEPMLRLNFPRNLERVKRLAHVFDEEHAKSVPLLNDLVGHLAEASGVPHGYALQMASTDPIREDQSTNSDHIQAADIAAGWAADLLLSTNNDYRALARQVRWITVNGIAVPA
jgi:hypothetical protein